MKLLKEFLKVAVLSTLDSKIFQISKLANTILIKLVDIEIDIKVGDMLLENSF